MKLKSNIDKLGVFGLFFTALFSPCCFPLFTFIGSALGLGSFELFAGWTMGVFLMMVLITIVGLILSYYKNHYLYPLLIAIPSALLILFGYYVANTYFIYTGMFGILIATGINYYRNKLYNTCNTCTMYNGKSVELKSTLTCPECGYKKDEIMLRMLVYISMNAKIAK